MAKKALSYLRGAELQILLNIPPDVLEQLAPSYLFKVRRRCSTANIFTLIRKCFCTVFKRKLMRPPTSRHGIFALLGRDHNVVKAHFSFVLCAQTTVHVVVGLLCHRCTILSRQKEQPEAIPSSNSGATEPNNEFWYITQSVEVLQSAPQTQSAATKSPAA